MMKELIFMVEEAPEGGYIAHALGQSIFTEGNSMEQLKENILDAVNCHFEDDEKPHVIRTHFVKEEVFTL